MKKQTAKEVNDKSKNVVKEIEYDEDEDFYSDRSITLGQADWDEDDV